MTTPPLASDVAARPPADPAALRERLADLMLRDERRLLRRLDGTHRIRRPEALRTALDEIAAQVDAAERRIAARRAAVPDLSYPASLPISDRRAEILEAIRDHQVVVVAGETGSGKTTQLPKMCLELGRGVRAAIGHTQPRRLAARTVAERIADELATPLGDAVGYQVRFTDRASESTLVKLMTDGILLNEIQQDRMLYRYDTIIIDEAHERSLNVDFLLGYLRQLLPKRPDLKLIITSATIDPERFSRHFGDAPVIEVSGRTYPVDVRYRPLVDPDRPELTDRDQVQGICDAVEELVREGPGDILVFLSGEREIRDAAEALQRLHLWNTEILPLYARLSAAEQHRVFQPHAARRVVLATNVAETSLTVPGIHYVVDPGTARISRYSHRTKVQRLPIEPISRASADQRKGRCGRIADGICIRLYSEQDFIARPQFTEPEILRTNLASVILQMTALGLGDVAAFPFVDPPDRRNVADGVRLLLELGALDPGQSDPRKRLTPLGRTLAQVPIDPRLARMVLEADRNGCLREVLVIAAGLSIQDPRERPTEQQEAADQQHARFADPQSDFLSYLNLWRYVEQRQRELSSSQFRRMCRTEFLNYLRIREWQDLCAQLRQVARGLGLTLNDGRDDSPGTPDRIHLSLLAGLLSHIGLRDPEKRDYHGAHGARFAVFPGSALFRKPPEWVVAAELVETSRLWGRIVARIQPDWAERLGEHLVKRSYSEPHWEKKRGQVVAFERVTLYGVPLVAGRKVGYGQVDPELARELFIRHALVEGDWDTHHRFFHDNRALLDDVEDLEHRARRRDILVDDEALFEFYDRRIGPEVVSARHFDSWWKTTRRTQPDLLDFTTTMLINAEAAQVSERDYPDQWRQGALRLSLTYQFEPGADDDGVTVHVPLAALNQVRPEGFDWQVPGLREELATSLIKSLPKALRRGVVPAPDHARAALRRITERQPDLLEAPPEPFVAALERELLALAGVDIPRDAWDPERVPGHLRITFRVEDDGGREIARGRDLEALRARLGGRLRGALTDAAPGLERAGVRDWDLGTLPRTVERPAGVGGGANGTVRGYPALVEEGIANSRDLAVRILPTPVEQERAMWRGTRQLLMLTVPAPLRAVQARLPNDDKLALSHNPHGSVPALIEDCVGCAVDRIMTDHGGPAWDEAGFRALQERVRTGLEPALTDVVSVVARVLQAAGAVERRMRTTAAPALLPALVDVRSQLSGLIYPGFVTATGWQRLPDLLRYLRALDRRLEVLPERPERDRQNQRQVEQVQQAYQDWLARLPLSRRDGDDVRQVGWMIEELRVSLFAQTVGAAYPVSEKRIRRAMDAITVA